MTAFEMLDIPVWRYSLHCVSGFVLAAVAYVLLAAWVEKEREEAEKWRDTQSE